MIQNQVEITTEVNLVVVMQSLEWWFASGRLNLLELVERVAFIWNSGEI